MHTCTPLHSEAPGHPVQWLLSQSSFSENRLSMLNLNAGFDITNSCVSLSLTTLSALHFWLLIVAKMRRPPNKLNVVQIIEESLTDTDASANKKMPQVLNTKYAAFVLFTVLFTTSGGSLEISCQKQCTPEWALTAARRRQHLTFHFFLLENTMIDAKRHVFIPSSQVWAPFIDSRQRRQPMLRYEQNKHTML